MLRNSYQQAVFINFIKAASEVPEYFYLSVFHEHVLEPKEVFWFRVCISRVYMKMI